MMVRRARLWEIFQGGWLLQLAEAFRKATLFSVRLVMGMHGPHLPQKCLCSSTCAVTDVHGTTLQMIQCFGLLQCLLWHL